MTTRAWALVALLLAGCEAPAAELRPEGPTPLQSWIAAEVERLAATAADLGDDGEEMATALAAVAAEADAGRPMEAAFRLSGIRLRIETRDYARSRRGGITDLAGLESEAQRVGTELDRLESALSALGERPAAVRALADGAWVHGRAYHRAAAAYARVTSIDAGLFYLGSGRSLLRLAADLAAVPLAGGGADRTPSAAQLEADLDDLDRRAIAAYRAPGAEVDRHADFIALNAEIKEARDLLAAERRHGALLAALEAHGQLAEIEDTGTSEVPEVRERAAAFRERIEAAAWDASVGRLFLERVEADLAPDSPSPAAVRRARAVLLHVLPRYLDLHEETP